VRWYSVLFLVVDLEHRFEDLHARLSSVMLRLPGMRRPTGAGVGGKQQRRPQQGKASQAAGKQQQSGAPGLQEVRVESPKV
jgi:hypothetical protein